MTRNSSFSLQTQYVAKKKSYECLTEYIQQHKDYDSLNEWGSHEILSKFHEVVLAAKFLIAKKFNTRVNTHIGISDFLSEIDASLSDDYENLKKLARLMRYELYAPDKGKSKDFKVYYDRFMKKINKIK